MGSESEFVPESIFRKVNLDSANFFVALNELHGIECKCSDDVIVTKTLCLTLGSVHSHHVNKVTPGARPIAIGSKCKE